MHGQRASQRAVFVEHQQLVHPLCLHQVGRFGRQPGEQDAAPTSVQMGGNLVEKQDRPAPGFILDEPGMGEDYDAVLRLRQAGWKCIVGKSLWIKHVGSQTFGKMGFNELLQASYGKLIDKYGVDGLRELGIEVKTAGEDEEE